MRKILVFCLIIIVFGACKKENELLSGDIIGKVKVYNQDLTATSDNSGVEVSLFRGSTMIETNVTDSRGHYRFEEISYGKYKLILQMDGYVQSLSGNTFNHVGGYSPTIFDGYISEIPNYILTVDSVKPYNGDLLLYVKIDGSNVIPFFFYSVIGYCGNDLTVSKDNYSYIISGAVMDGYALYPDEYFNANAVMRYLSLPQSPNKVYVRFYLLTNGQSIYSPINKEALGKPSNVMSFVWQ